MNYDKVIDEYKQLTEAQQIYIYEKITQLLIEDFDDCSIAEYKKKIYSIYEKDIADLIAEMEVYSHDLPEYVYGYTDTIVKGISSLSNGKELFKKCSNIEKCELFLINSLQIDLGKYYISRIKKYRRVLKCFNYKGVSSKGTKNIIEIIKHSLKRIAGNLKQGKAKHKKMFRYNRKDNSIELRLKEQKDMQQISELEDALKESRETIELCEKMFPDVIENGYRSSLWKALLKIGSYGITLAMAIYTIISLFQRLG